MDQQKNPYAASDHVQPSLDVGPAALLRHLEHDPQAEALRIRRRYIRHEAAIRSVGLLYCVTGGLMAVGTACLVVESIFGGRSPAFVERWFGLSLLVLLGLTALCLSLGIGLRRLRIDVRTPVVLLAFLGLGLTLVLAVLTTPAALCRVPFDFYVIYVLLDADARVVFSSSYAEVRRQTPHVRYPVLPVLVPFLLLVFGVMGPPVITSLSAPPPKPPGESFQYQFD